jgi:flagellar motor protein MotB
MQNGRHPADRGSGPPTSAATTATSIVDRLSRWYLASKASTRRLSSQGCGETQPIDRRSNGGMGENRRVAFLILKRASD